MTDAPVVLLADLNSYRKRQPQGVQQVQGLERFEAAADPALGLADAFRHGAELPVMWADEDHDPIRLTEGVGAENDPPVVAEHQPRIRRNRANSGDVVHSRRSRNPVILNDC